LEFQECVEIHLQEGNSSAFGIDDRRGDAAQELGEDRRYDDDEIAGWRHSPGDYMFLTAMSIQEESASRVIDRCKKLGAKVDAGFLFTAMPKYFLEVDLIMIF